MSGLLEPGQVVGNYVVEAEIGLGGMAVVYRVRHRVLESTHALKVLLPHLLREEHLLERFLEEAKLQARFRHPSLVRVTDIVSEPGIAGLVMDHLVGDTLETLITRGPIAPREACRWSSQTCGALSYIHTRGVVHRDVKPGNLLVEPVTGLGTQVRLMDFGVAKVHLKSRTRTAVAMGTPAYMSPEQVDGSRRVDARSDLFSLGVVLYEMLTGRLPFEGETDYALQQAIVSGRFIGVRRIAPHVSEHLADVVDKALQVKPEERFGHARAMAEQIRAVPEAKGRDADDFY
ncbi:MAG: serine/threonine protein kinase [Alphaproteobacteria bacterium]|nr:serine/threonine protein kinase [Alphaproteobacteria bacterium]